MNDDRTPDSITSTDDSADDSLVDAVKEYMALLEQGTPPPLEEYLEQHAFIARELRPALEGLALLQQAGDKTIKSAMDDRDSQMVGKPIGDFQIVRELGRGGMGIVYEAVQLSLGRPVALKVLPFASGFDEIRLQRFRNEAHAAAALHHTNIVPVFAVGVDRGVHYYAMQLINGQTLSDVIDDMRAANALEHLRKTDVRSSAQITDDDSSSTAESQVETARQGYSTVLSSDSATRRRYYQTTVRMVHQAALALEHAHQYGVVHRDIKPANLLLDSTGKIWVTDFGLAQVQALDTGLTRTGDPMGTLRYMSPEQASGKKGAIDHRSDIYSLGVTLYELLTLHPAIMGEGYRDLINHVVEKEPPSPQSVDPELPTELDIIVTKAIAKSPTERYESAQALADDLLCWLEDKPIQARPPTVLERLSKWRRRNSGLVAVVSILLLFATIGLAITTFIVWNEEHRTEQALKAERQQRQLAEENYQQAKEAIDTFISLSESELPYYPMEGLRELRRDFLETSLKFYRRFLEERQDDQELEGLYQKTQTDIEWLTMELNLLDRIMPLLQLEDPRIREEVKISQETADDLVETIQEFDLRRRRYGSTSDDDLKEFLIEFEQTIENKIVSLEMWQTERLKQIGRQQRLPFTFKTTETAAALGLDSQQRSEINRIIESHRPPMNGKPFFKQRIEKDSEEPTGQGPTRVIIDNTVEDILNLLSPQQYQKWKDFVGEPFEFEPDANQLLPLKNSR